jgi:hypothetical protein
MARIRNLCTKNQDSLERKYSARKRIFDPKLNCVGRARVPGSSSNVFVVKIRVPGSS